MVIMEFETENKGQQSDNVTDEARLAASSKRVTLSPLHAEIVPDSPAEEAAASHHVLEPPIGNIPSDQESTDAASLATVSPAEPVTVAAPAPVPQKSKALPVLLGVGVVALVAGIIAVIVIFR